MIIQFNSFQFAVNVESPNEDYNLLDNEKFISLKIKQVVRNNITNRNIKFLYYWFNIENNITEIKAVKWKYNMFPTINSSIVKLFINCRLMVWGLQPTVSERKYRQKILTNIVWFFGFILNKYLMLKQYGFWRGNKVLRFFWLDYEILFHQCFIRCEESENRWCSHMCVECDARKIKLIRRAITHLKSLSAKRRNLNRLF